MIDPVTNLLIGFAADRTGASFGAFVEKVRRNRQSLGPTFRIYMPRQESKAASDVVAADALAADAAKREIEWRPGEILLVEDEDEDEDAVRAFAQKRSWPCSFSSLPMY